MPEEMTPNRAARRAHARRSRKVAAVGSGVVLAAGTLGALGVVAQDAGAAPAVTNLNDSGPGSLRDALDNANDGDVIDLTALSGTILLTSQIDIEDAVTIMGPGASVLSISGGNTTRVFSMYGGLDEGQTLTITGVTITNGNDDEPGDGIYFNCTGESDDIASNLVLDGVAITNNTSTDDLGGGLYFDNCDDRGNLTISNSVISGNQALADRAGGIWFDDAGQLSITNTTISANTASENGGGVYFDDGADLEIVNSTFAHNMGDAGGGIFVNDLDGNGLIANSTFTDNHAVDGGGGAIATDTQSLTIFQTTISGNTASTAGDGLYMTGYLPPPGGTSDGKQGQDVDSQALDSTVVLSGTIIAGNDDGADDIATDSDENASLQTDHSVLGAIGEGITVDDQGGNQFDVSDPGLDPLASNGGPTQTMALKPTSVALNAGPDPVPDFPLNTDDQRGPGFPRVQFGRVDVGAYEVQPPPEEEIVEVTPLLAG